MPSGSSPLDDRDGLRADRHGGDDDLRDHRRLISAMDAFSRPSLMAMDLSRTRNGWRVDLDVPGMDPSHIEVAVAGRVLSVRGERNRRCSAEPDFAEREHGTFMRELLVGEGLDLSKCRVSCHRGVLTIEVPFDSND
jgi:HSP20 family protein